MHSFFKVPLALGLLAISSAPAFADPDGFVSGGLGANNISVFDESFDSPLVQLRGSASGMFSPTLTMQGDVVMQYQSYDFADDLNLDLALHAAYREEDRFLIGGFVQLGNQFESYDDDSYSGGRTFVAAEGQVYLDDVTLYLQVGGVSVEPPGFISYNGYFATAELRYFLTDDLRLDVRGLAMRTALDAFPEYPTDTYGVGIGAEYRLPDSAISLFANADIFANQNKFNAVTDSRVLFGIKFNFGPETLKGRDRSGATLSPVQQFPFYFIPGNGAD
jgi:hypothetical protein